MGAKKRRVEDTSAQRANQILLESFDRLSRIAFGEHGLRMKPTNNAKSGNVTKITLDFSMDGQSSMCIAIEMVGDDDEGYTMYISCTHKNATVLLRHLSVFNGAKYAEVAKATGIPAPLDEAAHMTEFCVALITPLFEQSMIEEYLEPLDTIERDGIAYYTGYGGLMRARFPPSYCTMEDSFTIAYLYGSDVSD